jgi:hypothetical protein
VETEIVRETAKENVAARRALFGFGIFVIAFVLRRVRHNCDLIKDVLSFSKERLGLSGNLFCRAETLNRNLLCSRFGYMGTHKTMRPMYLGLDFVIRDITPFQFRHDADIDNAFTPKHGHYCNYSQIQQPESS